jgi:hypothetical protein
VLQLQKGHQDQLVQLLNAVMFARQCMHWRKVEDAGFVLAVVARVGPTWKAILVGQVAAVQRTLLAVVGR